MPIRSIGRGRGATRPSWMSEREFDEPRGREADALSSTALGHEAHAASASTARPCHAPVVSRTVVLRCAIDSRRLHNPYIDERERRIAATNAEQAFRERCAQFGFVNSVQTLDDRVLITFAELESAGRCINDMHGRRLLGDSQPQCVADYAFDESRSAVSRAVILSNVFDPDELHPDHRDSFLSQLAVDFEAECSQHGPVKRVDVLAGKGSIRICFESCVSAADAIGALNGRGFDQRQLIAEYDLGLDASEPPPAEWDEPHTQAAAASIVPSSALVTAPGKRSIEAAYVADSQSKAPKHMKRTAGLRAKPPWGDCHPRSGVSRAPAEATPLVPYDFSDDEDGEVGAEPEGGSSPISTPS
jgi:hypothetical protein